MCPTPPPGPLPARGGEGEDMGWRALGAGKQGLKPLPTSVLPLRGKYPTKGRYLRDAPTGQRGTGHWVADLGVREIFITFVDDFYSLLIYIVSKQWNAKYVCVLLRRLRGLFISAVCAPLSITICSPVSTGAR